MNLGFQRLIFPDYGYGGGNQYNNTSYGGQGGAGGGGWMPGSQTSPSGAKVRSHSIIYALN
jgi:hypothetical protein